MQPAYFFSFFIRYPELILNLCYVRGSIWLHRHRRPRRADGVWCRCCPRDESVGDVGGPEPRLGRDDADGAGCGKGPGHLLALVCAGPLRQPPKRPYRCPAAVSQTFALLLSPFHFGACSVANRTNTMRHAPLKPLISLPLSREELREKKTEGRSERRRKLEYSYFRPEPKKYRRSFHDSRFTIHRVVANQGVVMVNLKARRRTLGIAPEVSQES